MLSRKIFCGVCLVAALAVLTPAAMGQIIYGQPGSGSFRFIYSHWELDTNGEKAEVDQTAMPFTGFVPLRDNLEARLYLAGSSTELDTPGDNYKVSGMGDIRLQLNKSLADDRYLLSAGLNLPTGKKELSLDDEWPVIEYLAFDFLSLPIRRLGEGFGFNLLAGAAVPAGEYRLGGSAMFQFNGEYKAYDGGGDYNPGDMISLSAGVDRQFDNLLVRLNAVLALFTTDKLDGEKVFRQSNQVDLGLSGIFEREKYSLAGDIRYLIRGRNTRYDTTEAILDQLKIYGNEFAAAAGLTYRFSPTWNITPSLEYRKIGANEYDRESSDMFGIGTDLGLKIVNDVMLDIGFVYFTGSGDGGDVDISGMRITSALAAEF